jgi:hypothetical protein
MAILCNPIASPKITVFILQLVRDRADIEQPGTPPPPARAGARSDGFYRETTFVEMTMGGF